MINKRVVLEATKYFAHDVNGKSAHSDWLEPELLTRETALKSIAVNNYVDTITSKFTFSKFTNNGKLSKQDENYSEDLAVLAEEELVKVLNTEKDIERDTKRALLLKSIVDNADFNSELTTIKTKNSHSNWYQNGGSLNSVSEYLTKVPTSVLDEALELQSIRKKYENSDTFDFYKTSYKTIVERIADHENDSEWDY